MRRGCPGYEGIYSVEGTAYFKSVKASKHEFMHVELQLKKTNKNANELQHWILYAFKGPSILFFPIYMEVPASKHTSTANSFLNLLALSRASTLALPPEINNIKLFAPWLSRNWKWRDCCQQLPLSFCTH